MRRVLLAAAFLALSTLGAAAQSTCQYIAYGAAESDKIYSMGLPADCYVYEHWRPDTNVCFWVGKGSGKRALVFYRRNKWWTSIFKHLSTKGLKPEVKIVASGLSDDEAYRREIERITFWRAQGVVLANWEAGGNGGQVGIPRSLESRMKQSATIKGKPRSAAFCEKMREVANRPERRALISAIHLGRKRSAETAENIRRGVSRSWTRVSDKEKQERLTPLINFVRSPEGRAQSRKPRSAETRAKVSAATKKQWAENAAFRQVVSETMKATNARRRKTDA